MTRVLLAVETKGFSVPMSGKYIIEFCNDAVKHENTLKYTKTIAS